MLLGTIVNVLSVLLGGAIGAFTKKGIPKRFEELIMNAIGLVTIVIGITYAIKTENILIVVVSLVVGAIVGEWIDIDKGLNAIGSKLQKFFPTEENSLAEVVVTATLLFCVGSMAIMGALDSGLRLNHNILYTKSVLDGIAALLFASSIGIGVVLSVIPLAIYQGGITLLAHLIAPYLSTHLMTEMNAVGGILLMALGLSLLHIKSIKVANLLPAMFVAAIMCLFI